MATSSDAAEAATARSGESARRGSVAEAALGPPRAPDRGRGRGGLRGDYEHARADRPEREEAERNRDEVGLRGTGAERRSGGEREREGRSREDGPRLARDLCGPRRRRRRRGRRRRQGGRRDGGTGRGGGTDDGRASGALDAHARHRGGRAAEEVVHGDPELVRGREAVARLEGDRALDQRLEAVRHVSTAGAGGGPLLAGADLVEVCDLLADEGGRAHDELGEDEAEGVHVGPRAGRAEALGSKLLGGAVVRRERVEAARGVGRDLGRRVTVLHRLRDAEVEDLEGGPGRRLDREEVRGLEIAVGDLVGVRERDRLHHRPHEEQRLLLAMRRLSRAAAGGEDLLQLLPLEPLEHEVRDVLPARGAGHVEIEDADDRGVLGEAREERPLLAELLEEEGLGLGGEVAGQLEALHRDRVLEREVEPSVHDAEASLADDSVDPIAVVDGRADETEQVAGHVVAGG